MSYLVFANDDGPAERWHVGQGELARLVAEDWPDAVVQQPTPADDGPDGRGFRWTDHVGGDEIEAWINKDGTCLYLDGQFDGILEVVSWFRRKTPRDIEFALCDVGYSFCVVIDFGATADEIAVSVPG